MGCRCTVGFGTLVSIVHAAESNAFYDIDSAEIAIIADDPAEDEVFDWLPADVLVFLEHRVRQLMSLWLEKVISRFE